MKLFVVFIVVVLALLCSQARGSQCVKYENDKKRCKRTPPQMIRRLLSRRSCPYTVDANGKVQCKIIRRQMLRRLRCECWIDKKGKEICVITQKPRKKFGN
ncbi:hypothetical protein Q1695_005459 [Nippostrongylus brasiliensis]|nr:hypothetical protein Q1695_005459 [Nippostrongylus brasiliensis]